MDGKEYIGCCGVYCKTCRSFVNKTCKGCKIGYSANERNINRTGCKVKKCCFRDNNYDTCADCQLFPTCSIMENWYNKGHGKYEAYRIFIEFIKERGYAEFVKAACNWKNFFGKLI